MTDRPCTSTGDADGSGRGDSATSVPSLYISPHHPLCPPPLASCGVRMPIFCFSHRLNIFIYIICCWGQRGDIWARLRVCGLEVGSFHLPCVTPYPSSQASLHAHADHTSIHPSFHPFIHPSIHPHTYLACSARPNSPPTHTHTTLPAPSFPMVLMVPETSWKEQLHLQRWLCISARLVWSQAS